MAFVRKKRVKGSEYYQLVENIRESGKVRQKVLVHLGRYPSVDVALEQLPGRIARSWRTFLKYPPRMQPGTERRIVAEEARLAKLRDLRERGVA